LKLWLLEGQEIPELLSTMLDNKPTKMLLKDYLNVVLDLMQTVYRNLGQNAQANSG